MLSLSISIKAKNPRVLEWIIKDSSRQCVDKLSSHWPTYYD